MGELYIEFLRFIYLKKTLLTTLIVYEQQWHETLKKTNNKLFKFCLKLTFDCSKYFFEVSSRYIFLFIITDLIILIHS